jgi:hypothetical protein
VSKYEKIFRVAVIEPGAVFLVWLVSAWPFLDPATSVYGFDTLAYTGPNLQTTFDAWRGFSFPLWQADVFGGVPFLGRLGAQGLYLPHLPLVIFDVNTALDLGAALHLLLLAFGLFVLVRLVFGMLAPAGFVAAAAVLGSSYVAIKMMSYDQLVAIAWLPWVIICIELAIQHPRRVSVAGPLAMATGLLVLGGHPQYIYFAALLVMGYVVLRLLDTRAWRSVLTLALGGALALALTSLQLVAAYFLNSSSGIPSKRTLAALANPSYVLPPSRLPIGIFGDPFTANPTQATGAGEAILGLGLPIVLLAIVGVFFGQKFGRFTRYGLAFGCVLGISLAVGPRWFPFRVLYEIVPGFGSARVAGRWLLVPLILGALLAADGVGVVIASARNSRRVAFMVATAAIGLVAFWVGPFEVPRSSLVMWWIAAIASMAGLFISSPGRMKAAIAWSWVMIFVGIGSLIPLGNSPATFQRSAIAFDEVPKPLVNKIGLEGGRVFAQTFDRFDNAPYLLEQLRPNANALENVESIDGYDGGQWIQQRWIDMVESLTNGQFSTDLNVRSQTRFPLSADLLRRFGVRWALVDASVLPANQQLSGFTGPVGRSGDVELWENPKWVGHAIAYLKAEVRSESLGEQLRSASPDVVIVDDERHAIECEGDCFAQGVSALYENDSQSAYIFNIASDGILALDQGWSPDWKVYIDGVRAGSFPVNGNQTGVYFTAGYHKVEFNYDPVWVNPFLALGTFAFLIAVAMGLVTVRAFRGDNATELAIPDQEPQQQRGDG